MPEMIEIERKFIPLKRPSDIERQAAERDCIRSRKLLQQRYLPLKGWRIRLRRRMPSGGIPIHHLVLKKDGLRIDVAIDRRMHDKLMPFCSDPTVEDLDAGGTCERRKLRSPSDWIFRIRRTSHVSGSCPRHEVTMKKPITTASCHEPESEISGDDHDAIARHCGPALRKRRVKIEHAGRIWELDTFLNPELEDLALVEVELPSESTRVVLPDWVGREVTAEKEYRNAVIEKRLTA